MNVEETANTLSRDEKSMMLYVESCCVDGGGILVGERMNAEDLQAAAKLEAEGYMRFGRIPAELIRSLSPAAPRGSTHYAELTDTGWELAHVLRRARGGRRGPYATAVFAHEIVVNRSRVSAT